MNVLCVYPVFPKTYWGAEYALPIAGKKALLPSLGLLTVAALLPRHWAVRLCDANVRALEVSEIDWADVVFLSGMLIQRESMHEVARRCRERGKLVVAGGAYASTSPDALAPHVDCVVVGEAEELMGPLAAALEQGRGHLPKRLQASKRPDLRSLPPPRFELLDVNAYQTIGLQWSRGCPFNCEFCDIIEIFGRHPRAKTPAQLLGELEAVEATGFRGSVFIVDDNFIGNKAEARRLLAPLAEWMRAHGDPFDFYTEATVNLANDDALIRDMVEAGFTSVFLGIETPSEEALRETQKLQNTSVDLDEAVRKLIASGLEVLAGFIVGFDADDAEAVERQRRWIARSPIPLAMVGLLIALPGTQLERRLAREGRLLAESNGDSFTRPNFVTRMDEAQLLAGYRRLLAELYAPDAYFERALRSLALCPDRRERSTRVSWNALASLGRSVVRQGLLGEYRASYWRFLLDVARRAPRRFARAVGMAVQGEHMIRYTAEEVLPRLDGVVTTAPRAPDAGRAEGAGRLRGPRAARRGGAPAEGRPARPR